MVFHAQKKDNDYFIYDLATRQQKVLHPKYHHPGSELPLAQSSFSDVLLHTLDEDVTGVEVKPAAGLTLCTTASTSGDVVAQWSEIRYRTQT
jgi:hypothetical protein